MPREAESEAGRERRDEIRVLLLGSWMLLNRPGADGKTPRDKLADALDRHTRAVVTATVAHEVEQTGGDPDRVHLRNRTVLDGIRAQSESTADGIVATHQADLTRFAEAVPLDTPNEELPGLLNQWSAARATWKTPQIATTETVRAQTLGQREFVERSGVRGYALFGGTVRCDLCLDAARGNPWSLDDPQLPDPPLHPNCGDSMDVQYTDRLDDPWLGD